MRKKWGLLKNKEKEEKVAIVSAIFFTVLFSSIDLYKNFIEYQSSINTLILCLLAALIGMIGFSLSGIAIITSMFSGSDIKCIEKCGSDKQLHDVFSSYGILAKHIGYQCLVLVAYYFLIESKIPIAPKALFYMLLAIEIYHIAYIIFYAIGLVENCLKLYEIKKIFAKAQEENTSFYELVNNVKIEYIISTISNITSTSKKDIIEDLIRDVEESNSSEKKKIIAYLKEEYQGEK